MSSFGFFLTWRLWYAWLLASAAGGIVGSTPAELGFYAFALAWSGWCFLREPA